jgi:hypothetical protein
VLESFAVIHLVVVAGGGGGGGGGLDLVGFRLLLGCDVSLMYAVLLANGCVHGLLGWDQRGYREVLRAMQLM